MEAVKTAGYEVLEAGQGIFFVPTAVTWSKSTEQRRLVQTTQALRNTDARFLVFVDPTTGIVVFSFSGKVPRISVVDSTLLPDSGDILRIDGEIPGQETIIVYSATALRELLEKLGSRPLDRKLKNAIALIELTMSDEGDSSA